MTVYEMEYWAGVASPRASAGAHLRTVQSDILAAFNDRVLPLDRNAAEWAARFRARNQAGGSHRWMSGMR